MYHSTSLLISILYEFSIIVKKSTPQDSEIKIIQFKYKQHIRILGLKVATFLSVTGHMCLQTLTMIKVIDTNTTHTKEKQRTALNKQENK
jgi:hypothetical protein